MRNAEPFHRAIALSCAAHLVIAAICFFIRYDSPQKLSDRPVDVWYEIIHETVTGIQTMEEPPSPVHREDTPISNPNDRRRNDSSEAPAHTEASHDADNHRATPVIDMPSVAENKDNTEASKHIVALPDSPREFTPFAHGDVTVPYADSSQMTPFEKGQTLFADKPWALHPSGRTTKGEKIAPEDARDKRRDFDPSIMGIEMQGPLAVFPGVRHVGKTIVRGIKDDLRDERRDELYRTMFATVNEKDVRFMILMWRDGLLDLIRISKQDKMFVAKTRAQKPETNHSYLLGMDHRGLAEELEINGRLVFRASVARNEMLSSLGLDVYASDDSLRANTDKRMEMVRLITVCYDPVTQKVTIPDSLYSPNR